MRIERVDPQQLDLETADSVAAVFTACEEADGVPGQPRTGAGLLTSRRLGSEMKPVDAMFLAYDGDRVVGEAIVELPWRDNRDAAYVSVRVHPDVRRRGLGSQLWEQALAVAADASRSRIQTGAWLGGVGADILDRAGFTRTGVGVIRRIDLHETPPGTWDRLHAEAAPYATDYELTRYVGSTPPELQDAVVRLHEAIADAPSNDPKNEPDVWDADRLETYEQAMAGRRQTLYRVLARHKGSGELAGHTLLCLNEFSPTEAFQEDTTVLREHRGHRLGLLLKTTMLAWVSAQRPELQVIDTWNGATNHHMIAINERLGATVVARRQTFRLDR